MTNNYIKLSEGSIIQTDDILRVSKPQFSRDSEYDWEIRIVWANKCVEIIKYCTIEKAESDYNLLALLLLQTENYSLICD